MYYHYLKSFKSNVTYILVSNLFEIIFAKYLLENFQKDRFYKKLRNKNSRQIIQGNDFI